MKLPKNVKPKSKLWKMIPWLSKYTANAIYPNIYVPEDIYKNLQTNKPKTEYIAVLIHEQTHIKRQKQIGWIKYGLFYLLSPKFRFDEELLAIKEAMKHLKKNNRKYDLERHAKYLSSWLYLWCTSYKTALSRLKSLWKEA